MRVRIVRATAEDADLCLSLHRASAVEGFRHVFPPALYPFPDAQMRAQWVSALADPQVEVHVAYLDGNAAGTVSIGHDYLRTLYVVPGAWNAGVGSALHDFALERLRATGVRRARLWTLTENRRARAFYEKRGWTLTGRTRVVPFPPHPLDVEYARVLA